MRHLLAPAFCAAQQSASTSDKECIHWVDSAQRAERQALGRGAHPDMGDRVRVRAFQIDHRHRIQAAVGRSAVTVVGGDRQLRIG